MALGQPPSTLLHYDSPAKLYFDLTILSAIEPPSKGAAEKRIMEKRRERAQRRLKWLRQRRQYIG